VLSTATADNNRGRENRVWDRKPPILCFDDALHVYQFHAIILSKLLIVQHEF